MTLHSIFPDSSNLVRWLATAVLLPLASSSSPPQAGAANYHVDPVKDGSW